MSDKARIMAAVRRYGPTVDRVAAKYGISGSALLAKLVKGETNFTHKRGGRLTTSSAGARGAAQFMPETRAAFIKRYGVDAWASPEEAVHAASIYLRKSGLAAYNPGMKSYSSYILGQHVGDVGSGPVAAPGALPGGRVPSQGPTLHTDKLAALRQALATGGKNPLIEAKRLVDSGAFTTRQPGIRGERLPAAPRQRGGGSIDVAAGADRAGVPTKPEVKQFVRGISALTGQKYTIGTGSRHSRMTVDGNVSAHWTGDAADIPLRGRPLITAGQAALIAAGMNPRKARQQKGGLYNVGGWQIIFNTHQGGDHTNHLHVGRRRG